MCSYFIIIVAGFAKPLLNENEREVFPPFRFRCRLIRNTEKEREREMGNFTIVTVADLNGKRPFHINSSSLDSVTRC